MLFFRHCSSVQLLIGSIAATIWNFQIVAGMLMLLLVGGGNEPQRFTCDLIELNHKIDAATGRECFTQVILWNWKPEVNRHHVDAWWIVDAQRLGLLPRKTFAGYVVDRFDGDSRRCAVSARMYLETTTINDPEYDDRNRWHESWRRSY